MYKIEDYYYLDDYGYYVSVRGSELLTSFYIDCMNPQSYQFTAEDVQRDYYYGRFTVTRDHVKKVFRPLDLLSLGETLSYLKKDEVRVNFYSDI